MMKKIILFQILILISFSVFAQNGRKLLRSESFWGLHFDRHSEKNDDHLGASLTGEMIDSMLRIARPDYIQVDSKGHPGISSYPTEVGQQAKSYDKDPLALIRKITNDHNVALYVHYSGVRDINYVELHPDEARFGTDGKSDGQNTSLWGPYVDKLLIPQLKELALKYKVDGAWVDGESWAVLPDYQIAALEEFKRTTGINEVPVLITDPNYKTFLEFNRKKFISYIKHYAEEIHKVAPGFQICSNFAYSSLIPEPVPEDIGLDFLSGDNSSSNSLNDANFHIRCLAEQGKPFDLMAWSFTNPNTPKTAIQLCQEGAAIISMGGGFQVYFQQNKDISFQPAMFGIMKDVADFILPRREYCKGVVPVPQIGLFYSTEGWKSRVNEVYRLVGVDGMHGVLNALLDGQHSVEILMTHQLKKRIKKYPVIVIPEWEIIEQDILKALDEYVQEGGKLLVIGAESTHQLEDMLGTKQVSGKQKVSHSLYYNGFVNINSQYRNVECLPDAHVFSSFYTTNDLRFPSGVAASVRQYGKGTVAGIYSDIGSSYLSNTSPVLRNFLSDIIKKLFPDELVKVEGSHKLNVVPTIKDDKLLIQLINTSGDHSNSNVKGIDEIPSLSNLKISVLTPKKPVSVLLQPDRTKLKFDFLNGRTTFILPELKIHNIIEII
jgi:hypothetical protein